MAAVGPSVESDLRPARNVAVLYIGADDCAPCRAWRKEHWPNFVTSPEFRQLDYREVVSPKLFSLKDDSHWPDDLRRYRDEFMSRSGVPYWVVMVDGAPTLTAQGLSEWEKVLSQLKALLR
jgi:hypothetical protein